MSGGVDSSVAAALLVEQGHDVTGVTLKLWGGESDSGCCSVADVEDARRVAAQLDIPHYVFNFTDEFDAAVVDPYVEAYADGSHAQSVRRVQPGDQVRPPLRACRRARVRHGGHRPPRAGRGRGRRHAAPPARRRPRQGPVVRDLHARPARAGPHDASGRRAHEGRGARARLAAGAPHRRQGGEHGRVLHHAAAGASSSSSRASARARTRRRHRGCRRRPSPRRRGVHGRAAARRGGGRR